MLTDDASLHSSRPVKVRVRRMTIQTVFGTFTQGNDCVIEEPLARQLRGQFLVWIYGEDDNEIKSGSQSESFLAIQDNESAINIGANTR